jgi:hypothetical protein
MALLQFAPFAGMALGSTLNPFIFNRFAPGFLILSLAALLPVLILPSWLVHGKDGGLGLP